MENDLRLEDDDGSVLNREKPVMMKGNHLKDDGFPAFEDEGFLVFEDED